MKIKPFWIEDLEVWQSATVQDVLFRNGCKWCIGTEVEIIPDFTHLQVNDKGVISRTIVGYTGNQLTYQEFMDLYGTKNKVLRCDKCHWMSAVNAKYCSQCGTKFPEPEPQVIIKRSCETWVARYDGVDYLCFDELIGSKKLPDNETVTSQFLKTIGTVWKPISEIEITDEIAKLRPMVILTANPNTYGIDEGVQMLTYIDNETITAKHMVCIRSSIKSIRLATVADLEDV
jgi:hypothetical protein